MNCDGGCDKISDIDNDDVIFIGLYCRVWKLIIYNDYFFCMVKFSESCIIYL